MSAFENYSTQIRSTGKEIVLEYFVPLLVEFFLLFISVVAFMQCVKLGKNIEEPVMFARQMTKPTAGRMAYGILALVLWLIVTVAASKADREHRHYASSLLGFEAGILLWQFIGEISWHFSVDGIHFVPFENVTTFPLACLFILLLIYGKKHHSFDWGVWCMLLSFAFNWMGHYVMEGTYPFVSDWFDQRTWYLASSAVAGGIGFVFSIVYLLFRARTRRGRILASMFTYIALGVIAFGIMES